jgi:pimeloyl-ACP methyl ester carboxylesterase
MKYLLIIIIPLISGCSFVDKLVVRNLYPFESVNRAYVVNSAPKDMNEVSLDKSINAWVYENLNSNVVMVVAHGNGENLEALNQYGFLDALKSLDVSFIVFDYPGLGKSTGAPDQESVRRATVAAVNWAEQNMGNKSLVLFGRSLGAAAAMQAVSVLDEKVLDGLVLVSAWASMKDAAVAMNGLAKLMSNNVMRMHEYNSLAIAKKHSVAKMIAFHGDKDELIPMSQGQQVAKALGADFKPVMGAGHNDLYNNASFWSDLRIFLNGIGK